MIHITITATGSTVAEALANARSIAFPLRPGGQLLLDGSVRPVHRGDNKIGSISATAETDVEKIAHYTGKDLVVRSTWAEPDDDEIDAWSRTHIHDATCPRNCQINL